MSSARYALKESSAGVTVSSARMWTVPRELRQMRVRGVHNRTADFALLENSAKVAQKDAKTQIVPPDKILKPKAPPSRAARIALWGFGVLADRCNVAQVLAFQVTMPLCLVRHTHRSATFALRASTHLEDQTPFAPMHVVPPGQPHQMERVHHRVSVNCALLVTMPSHKIPTSAS